MCVELTPENLLVAYATGIFPMADEENEVHWLAPDPRAVIELDEFRVSRSLRATVKQERFEVIIDRAFDQVIEACADRSEGTWISKEVLDAYTKLHTLGYTHSVECWSEGKLAGGLYGVALGGAFFGESMFHRVADASKVALVHLVWRMRTRGYSLLDVQFTTRHLERFGTIEITRSEYERRLRAALRLPCSFVDRAKADGHESRLDLGAFDE